MDNTQVDKKTRSTGNNYLIPVAIVLAGALVGAGIYFSGTQKTPPVADEVPSEQATQDTQQQDSLAAMNPVTEDDYIKGSLDAPIQIVEYSDFECPFCKRFHDTMNRVMDEYGESNEVAWVFRQFPLEQLHPIKARKVALASECAAEQGGDESFWRFTDRYFELTLTNNRTDIETVIPQIANEIGLDTTALTACVDEERYTAEVQADFENAVATGGRGTPWSILVAPDGSRHPINGAQPYETVVQIIEQIIAQ